MTGKTMPDKFYDIKMKSRKGCGINTIEDLLEEENVYYCRSFVPVDFLKTWKLGRILSALEVGLFSYAFPSDAEECRFKDEDIIHIEKRLQWSHTLESRAEIIRILCEYDNGTGDADDVIDAYEDECVEYANCDGFPISDE